MRAHRIEEVAENVYRKRSEIQSRGPYEEPSLVIYMDYDYYGECMAEIRGECSSQAFEFIDQGTLFGHRVYQVVEGYQRRGCMASIRHVPWRIVEV